MIPLYKNKGDIQNCSNLQGYQAAESHHEILGEGIGEEGEKDCVYFGESVQIHTGAVDYRIHSSCEKVDGAVQGEEEEIAHGVH